jgi:hypothetical protein
MTNCRASDCARAMTPNLLTLAEMMQVAGGGSNVSHGNPGGEPASYNTPGHEGYGGEGSGSTGPGIEIRD